MKKICRCCGKERDMLSWESRCYSCRKEENLRDVKERILSGELGGTECEDEIICPYCGEVNEYDIDYYNDIYTEGDKIMRCDYCEKEFNLCVNVFYSYDTSRLEENL